MTYIGLDIHKKTISFCVKDVSGAVLSEGKLPATRQGPEVWRQTLPTPWTVAMVATIFTGWIYDHFRPHAAAIKVAHPLMLRAIAVAKKKNDRMDAAKIADCCVAIFCRIRCLVPAFDGAYFSETRKEALWARFFTGAPPRQRRSVERYNMVKRA
jgi:hypothetical protein